MSQTQEVPTEGLTEMAELLAGDAATEIESMCCIKTTCTANAAATAAGITKCTESGLTLVNCDSVAAAAGVITAYETFTAGEAATVLGFGAFNNDDDALMGICCFNAAVSMEKDDTLKCTMTWTLSDQTA
jgi:hypothetical protein